MRSITLLTTAQFTKTADDSAWQTVSLPHTWNNLDGQDGGADYDRGQYRYRIQLPAPTAGKRQFIQFEGANHVATVFFNGKELGSHEGGFSTFRFELTQALNQSDNLLEVLVDNRENHVYPQQADFTFFGGLYRNVSLLEVEPNHFDLMRHGSTGVFFTPKAEGDLRTDAFVCGAQQGDLVRLTVLDQQNNIVLEQTAAAAEHTVLEGKVENPHLWNGINDAYCYTARVELMRGETLLDQVDTLIGFRSFSVDADKGFFLNGRSYPLHGVSRHQDRQDLGWAISEQEHAEDMALIREVGANTIRLAHYQHDQYFYDLCDRAGMVLWAEIPFISMFIEGEAAKQNTISQMTELVMQNYNHPSIFFWGISNEISIGGESPELLENLKELNELTHKLNPTRLTTMAQVSMLDMESEHNQITDVLSYNHYFGWYMGDVSENGPWLDEFHQKYPNRPLGVSEYGCEAILSWHSEAPEVQDYTEEYQSYYHEEMLKTFATRPYLWSTHVWNMFDFAADARDEGGCKGRNNKGLVTYDRKTRKDSFFAYKAFWTTTPFVHVCGRRFMDRAPGQRDIKVYSNCPQVTLLVNGCEVATLKADKIFLFKDVALQNGVNEITARAEGAADDVIYLNGVTTPNSSYILPQEENTGDGVANWFDDIAVSRKLEFPEGFFSIKDKMGEIMANPESAEVMNQVFSQMGGGTMNAQSMKNMLGMLKNMSVETILKMAGKKVPADAKYALNDMLNKIKK